MEYCCHPRVGTGTCYLDKLDKWVCMTVDPALSTSLEILTHHLNRARLNLFFRY